MVALSDILGLPPPRKRDDDQHQGSAPAGEPSPSADTGGHHVDYEFATEEDGGVSSALHRAIERLRAMACAIDALRDTGGTFELVVPMSATSNDGSFDEAAIRKRMADLHIGLR